MSKTALKKAIKDFDIEQLRELLLDVYSAKCDSRYYLDFFVNPDIESRLDAAKSAIDKELRRASRGYSKARISVIRKGLMSIDCLQPGAEYVLEIMVYSFVMICLTAHLYNFRDALLRGVSRLLNDIVEYADRNQLLDTCIEKLASSIEDIPSPFYRANPIKSTLKKQLEASLSSLSLTR